MPPKRTVPTSTEAEPGTPPPLPPATRGRRQPVATAAAPAAAAAPARGRRTVGTNTDRRRRTAWASTAAGTGTDRSRSPPTAARRPAATRPAPPRRRTRTIGVNTSLQAGPSNALTNTIPTAPVGAPPSPAPSASGANLSTPPRPFRFTLMSDMHTETFETAAHNNHPTVHTVNPTGGAEYLILAGDMGSPHTSKSRTLYETTLQRLATAGRFRRVFFIAGNHEFHGSSVVQTEKRLQDLADQCTAASAAAPRARVAAAAAATSTPFTFLNRTRINDLIPEHNVIILGCTLWSDIPTHPPEVAAHVYDNLKDAGDFHHIRLQPQNARGSHRLTVSEYNELHGRDRAWLEAELDDIWRTYRTSNDCDAGVIPGHPHAEPPRVVVITHHAPLMRWTSHPRFESAPVPRPMQHAFGTDLHQMFGGDRVSVWCYGHTHYSVDFTLHGTRVVANQVGYAQNQDRDGVVGFQGYDASKVFVA